MASPTRGGAAGVSLAPLAYTLTYGSAGSGSTTGQGAGWFGPSAPMRAFAPAEVAGRRFDYRPRNLRTDRVYGFSPVEQVMITVNMALRRQVMTLEYFTSGTVPDALIGVPETWGPDQIATYQTYWDSLFTDNLAARRRARFVPGKVALHQTSGPQLKGEFDEWLSRVVCFAFSISPQALIKQMNRASADTQKELAEEVFDVVYADGDAALPRQMKAWATQGVALLQAMVAAEMVDLMDDAPADAAMALAASPLSDVAYDALVKWSWPTARLGGRSPRSGRATAGQTRSGSSACTTTPAASGRPVSRPRRQPAPI